MSGSASIALEQAVLGHTLGFASMTATTHVYIALILAAGPPSESIGGNEIGGGGYIRMPAGFALLAPPANIAGNTTAVEFPIATRDWGAIGYFELWTAPSGGNRLYWGQLISPVDGVTPITQTVLAGDIIRFSVGALQVQATSAVSGSTSIGAYLPLGGGTMLGAITLAGDPTSVMQAATKGYVDAHSGTGGGPGFLPLSGGTMLGPLALAGNATLPLQAVPLQQLQSGPVISVLDHGAKGDGVTNDYSAIQTVLNTLHRGATIFIPDTGQPYMVNGLVIQPNTDLLIHGTLKLIAGSNISLININNASNITIRGRGVLDGNGAAQTIAGAATLGGGNNTNIQIEGLTIQNAYNWNVNITSSSNVKLDRVSLLGGVNSNEFAAGCDNCWITNSLVSGVTADGGWTFYGGVTNSGMTGCRVTNLYAGGVGVYSDAAQPAPCSNVVITGNVIHGCQTGAVTIGTDGSAAVAGVVQTGVTVTGNRCYNNVARGQQYADIWIDHGTGVTVTGNDLSGSGSSSASGLFAAGVFVGVASSGVNITGNTIWNEGNSGSGTGCGVYIQAANNVLVEANIFYDTQGTPTMANAIAGNAGADNAFIGNLFGALGGPAMAIVLASDTRVMNLSGNMLFAPGGIAPPTFTTRSAGAKLVLFPALSASSADFAIGVDSSEMWFGVPTSGAQFNWFAGTTPIAALSGAGVFTASGGLALGGLGNYANDGAAAAGGVAIGHVYRNGSAMMVRVA